MGQWTGLELVRFRKIRYATVCLFWAGNVARNKKGSKVRMCHRGRGILVTSGDPMTLPVGQVP